MADAAGFWSYARSDDEAETGRIRRLAESIKTEYAMLTGAEIDVFVDREDIEWGEEWRRRIDAALYGTAFFIAVVTPRYFGRPECRRELLTFAGHAASLGVDELLLPLLYVDVPDLTPESEDEVVALVARTQYVDWTALRLEDERSSEYRKGVHALAKRLVEIGEQVAGQAQTGVEPESGASASDEDIDDTPGFGDVLATSEEAMPQWQETVEAFTPVMEELARLADDTLAQIQASDARGGGFAGRIRVAAAYGRALDEPATQFLELSTRYASHLIAVDAGILTLIRLSGAELESDDNRRSACELFASIQEFAVIARENYEVMAGLSRVVGETAKFSREVRPATRKLQAGLQRVMDGQSVIDEWVRQIDASDIACDDAAAVVNEST
jgi:hypothetical protein